MLCNRWTFNCVPHFKSNSKNSMAEFNQKNLSQISMLKMDDPYQVAGKKINSKKSQSDFVYSYRPMYYFSRFFGLLPFSFVYDSNGHIQAPRIRIADGVWFVFTVVFYIVLAINSCQGIQIPKDAVPLIFYSNTLLLTVGLFNGATMIVVNMCVRFKFVAILKTITNFDKEASHSRFVFFLRFHESCCFRFHFHLFIPFPTQLQMSILGIHFNYKTAFILSFVFSQSVWFFSLLMFGLSQLNYGFYEGSYKLIEILGYYATCIVHDSLTAAPLVSFILLVCNLRKRFVALNNHLRYTEYFLPSQFDQCKRYRFAIIHVHLFLQIRSQFLDENNKVKPTIKIYKEDSVNTVKFVGYWHSALTDTMRLINFCFSISVRFRLISIL